MLYRQSNWFRNAKKLQRICFNQTRIPLCSCSSKLKFLKESIKIYKAIFKTNSQMAILPNWEVSKVKESLCKAVIDQAWLLLMTPLETKETFLRSWLLIEIKKQIAAMKRIRQINFWQNNSKSAKRI